MKIMVDTNIVISAALFPNPHIKQFWTIVSTENDLFLSSYAINEIRRVVAYKFHDKKHNMATFLQNVQYTIVHLPPKIAIPDAITIRDPSDYPILASAILADVDILITGDKDFDDVNIERPEILTISEFMGKYCNETRE
jgi:putative PIN family toxin of toxin-antitoxin system